MSMHSPNIVLFVYFKLALTAGRIYVGKDGVKSAGLAESREACRLSLLILASDAYLMESTNMATNKSGSTLHGRSH
jgi:hypothetical protein